MGLKALLRNNVKGANCLLMQAIGTVKCHAKVVDDGTDTTPIE